MRLFVTQMETVQLVGPYGVVDQLWPIGCPSGSQWVRWTTDDFPDWSLVMTDSPIITAGIDLGDPESADFTSTSAPVPYVRAVENHLGLAPNTMSGATMEELVKAMLPNWQIDLRAGFGDRVVNVVRSTTIDRRGRARVPHPKDRG